jgi:hypothetical protein
MGARIINATLSMSSIMRPDRSLTVMFGYWPDAFRDDDNLNTTWAIDDWPQRSGKVMDGLAQGMWADSNRIVWVEDIPWTGANAPIYRIVGVTKDSGGTPVGNVSVDLYLTVTDLLIKSTISDPNGVFGFGIDDNTTKYYIRAWRLAPPIQGTTVDTLVGQVG